ncbi:MAG: F0F1 ATP synthase subunit delta, partial [Roseibacillus sp.]|nr:F0F1 ATP synthase subunit delta [Roseibacillus sp.]
LNLGGLVSFTGIDTFKNAAEVLDAASQDRVKGSLAEKYGDDLSFEFKLNPGLLGGMRVRVGNDVWDGSVKTRLDRLANSF